MFASGMQILRHQASVASQILSARPRERAHTQTDIYCVISAEGLSQIKEREKKELEVIYQKELHSSNINKGV